MVKKNITINKHKRKTPKGKTIIIKPYKKRIRTKGKKITYKKIGTFMVAHDEKGNFRGSKITGQKKRRIKTKIIKKKTPAQRKREKNLLKEQQTKARKDYNITLDEKFLSGRISTNEYLSQIKK